MAYTPVAEKNVIPISKHFLSLSASLIHNFMSKDNVTINFRKLNIKKLW